MARIPAFAFVKRALSAAAAANGTPLLGRAISRRGALALAMGATAAACVPMGGSPKRRIGIIGGGVAGLTVAYRAALAEVSATVFESSNRLGGRMFTKSRFNEAGQFCELGGELVDTGHAALRALAEEVGVGVVRLAPEGDEGEDVFHIRGKIYSTTDMVRPDQHMGAFLLPAARIARDQAVLLDDQGEWTDRARALDAMSLADYLTMLRPGAENWVIDLIALAFRGEFGLPIEKQSALNLVDLIGADVADGFSMFGESDEAWRIEGGSSRLIDALVSRIGDEELKLGHTLREIAIEGERVALGFSVQGKPVREVVDAVVLALPFTRLRQVEGIEGLGLAPETLAAIQGLGYGDNGKVMVSTTRRPFAEALPGLPARLSGTIYSDAGAQIIWETSRGQQGALGVLTNYLTGVEDPAGTVDRIEAALRAVSPKLGGLIDRKSVASFFWARHPETLGSYASPLVGQYTTMLGAGAEPELGGKVHFAGEHTSADFIGYMNGAVESGERVARVLIGPPPRSSRRRK